MSIADIKKQATDKMAKSVETLRVNLTHVRTGRAHVGLLDAIKVDYYGSEVPINQVGNVTLADARTISIQPYEKKMVQVVEKAIRDSDLGVNPATSGDVIRIPMPPLTEERRRELAKLVHREGEDGSREHQGHQGDGPRGQITSPGEGEQDDRGHRDDSSPSRRERPEPSEHTVILSDVKGPRTPVDAWNCVSVVRGPIRVSVCGVGPPSGLDAVLVRAFGLVLIGLGLGLRLLLGRDQAGDRGDDQDRADATGVTAHVALPFLAVGRRNYSIGVSLSRRSAQPSARASSTVSAP